MKAENEFVESIHVDLRVNKAQDPKDIRLGLKYQESSKENF